MDTEALQKLAVMLSKMYDALVAGGAPEDKARAAAEELAGYESGFAKIETNSRSSNGWWVSISPRLYRW
jgi:hypothetical protein